ncbi:calcium-binding protein [Cypionkella sp. TWP1-2-1b2]|uniref:calcium-binding protein n=1 Tax=Cypionkella sp. TWP1-2-1b2 TaxID=2804675 RepID=UPI003CF77390
MGRHPLSGLAGSDTIHGNDGNDTLNSAAATGDLRLNSGAGVDLITSGPGNGTIYFSSVNDVVWSGLGNDMLYGDSGDDSLACESNDDQFHGGTGNDTVFNGAGNDTLTGGSGNDSFAFDTSGGHDLVSDFDMSLGGGHTTDQLDVSELHNADGSTLRPWDIPVSDDGHSQALQSFPGGKSVALGGVSPTQMPQHGMRWRCCVLLRAPGL